MHQSNYRPTRSQQLWLEQLVRYSDNNLDYLNFDIAIHHVLEDTPQRLLVQVEVRYKQNHITFCRVEL